MIRRCCGASSWKDRSRLHVDYQQHKQAVCASGVPAHLTTEILATTAMILEEKTYLWQ